VRLGWFLWFCSVIQLSLDKYSRYSRNTHSQTLLKILKFGLGDLAYGGPLRLLFVSGVLHDVVDEVLVLHHALGVDLDVLEDLVDLLLVEGLAEGAEDVLDLDSEDVAVGVLVEDLHTFDEVLSGAGAGERADLGEDGEELVEGDLLVVEVLGRGKELAELVLAAAVLDVDGLLPLLVGGSPAEGSDGGADLVPVDLALALGVEELPVVLPLLDLVGGKGLFFGHFNCRELLLQSLCVVILNITK